MEKKNSFTFAISTRFDFSKNLTNSAKSSLTEDQLKLLKYDNIKSELYKTNFDIGIQTVKTFEDEIGKYSYNWRSGGQFSKIKNKAIK